MSEELERPGYARFDGTETPKEVDRRMRIAFSPLAAMKEGYNRAFNPHHRWRDPRTGRFTKRIHS